MHDQGDHGAGPLWADGDMMFRVSGSGGEPDRLVKVRHPYALLGRSAGAHVPIDDRAVSARHAYLHLDTRGVYAVDLVTRTGTRINGTSRTAGWLRPGDWVEVAGRRVELLRIRLSGTVIDPPPCDDDLLTDTGPGDQASVTLEPRRSNDPPWVLGSELVFLGWSSSCGIQVKDSSVARTHCALIRALGGAYLVDLCGRQTWVEDQPVRGAAALGDGDLITLGSTQFTVRVELRERALVPEVLRADDLTQVPARRAEDRSLVQTSFGSSVLPASIDSVSIPAEARSELIAWVMGTIQGGQTEVIRRQGEFQLAITNVLRQIQRDNATLLNTHLSRIESIDRELASLRAEIQRRNAPPPPPNVPPLRIVRPTISPAEPGPMESKASTAWLLHRVNQLENENRSAWRDLLGRLSQARK